MEVKLFLTTCEFEHKTFGINDLKNPLFKKHYNFNGDRFAYFFLKIFTLLLKY